VESSCEFGIEPSGSIKCWKTIECPSTGDLSSSGELHRVSYLFKNFVINKDRISPHLGLKYSKFGVSAQLQERRESIKSETGSRLQHIVSCTPVQLCCQVFGQVQAIGI
jgi:hypothetical protein